MTHVYTSFFTKWSLCCFQTNLPLAALPLWWWVLYNCASATCRRGMTKRPPSGKQHHANRSITLPLCPPRQIADSWILFNSGAMPLGEKAKAAWPLRLATLKQQAMIMRHSGKAASGKLVGWNQHLPGGWFCDSFQRHVPGDLCTKNPPGLQNIIYNLKIHGNMQSCMRMHGWLNCCLKKEWYWLVNISARGGSFTKIVRGCACRTSKIWLSLYQFFAKFSTHQYTIFGRKAPNLD